MTNYTKAVDFAAKDSLTTGNSAKIVKGTEIDTEFNAISTAIATKANIAGPTFTGTVTIPTATISTVIVPDASDGATIGSSSLEFSDIYLADGALIYLGDDQDTTLTHVADTGILLNSTRQLQFGDSGTYIHQSADGVLDLVADTEIEINATTIDINGAADVSGNLAVGGNLTVTGTATIAGNLTFGDAASDTVAFTADVASDLLPSADNSYDLGASGSEWKDLFLDGTAHIDTLDIDENATVAGTLAVTGVISPTTHIDMPDSANIKLGAADDLQMYHDGSHSYITNATGTMKIATESSGIAVTIGHTTSETTVADNLTVTGNTSIGGNLSVTGTTTFSGNQTFGNAASDTVTFSADVSSDLLPSADGTYDLGASGSEWEDLYIDGTANIDSLVADTADINGGTIDGAVIGGASAAAGTFTDLTSTGTSTYATVDINGGAIDGTVIGANSAAAGTFAAITGTTGTFSSNVTISTADNTNVLTLKSTDADENSGPRLALTRDSGSPADDDYIGLISFNADDDGGNVTRFGYIVGQIADASDGSEDGLLEFYTTAAGTETKTLTLESGAATFTAGVNVTTADNTDTLTLTSTDADNNSGPYLRMYRNSASPADADPLTRIKFDGRNDNSQDVTYGYIQIFSTDVSDGTEDGSMSFYTMAAGTSTETLTLASGSVGVGISAPTRAPFHVHTSTDNYDSNIHLTSNETGSTSTDGFTISVSPGGADDVSVALIQRENDSMKFYTNATLGMTLDSGGDLAVGSVTSLLRLQSVDSGTGSLPTDGAVGITTENANIPFGVHNESNSATYSGIALETRTSAASRWLIANEWKGSYIGDLVFDRRTGGSASAPAMRIDSSGRVLIGGIAAASAETLYGGIVPTFQVEGTDVNSSSIGMFRNSNDTAGPILSIGKSRGTSVNSDTVVQSGDITGIIAFTGADGGERMRATAAIKSYVDGAPGDNDMPGRLSFWTTPDGAYDEVERVRIQKDGALRMGGSAFGNITGGMNYVTLADDATKTIALSGTATAGGALMAIYESASGDNALFHVGYGVCSILNANSSYANSDTDGKFCVIVSGHNISFKNRIGGSRNFNIMVYGAGNFNYNL